MDYELYCFVKSADNTLCHVALLTAPTRAGINIAIVELEKGPKIAHEVVKYTGKSDFSGECESEPWRHESFESSST